MKGPTDLQGTEQFAKGAKMKELVRLSKLLSERGYCSRREADRWIAAGWVKVDRQVIDVLGSKVNPDCHIEIDQRARADQKESVTIALNKPLGYACSPSKENYQLAKSLLGEYAELPKLEIAGRLDINSRGLLIFTSDGRVAKKLIQADTTVSKEYVVRVKGIITEEKIKMLQHGLELDNRPLKPAVVKKKNENTLIFELKEGRKRQIRRMCELVSLEPTYLKRVRIGKLQLGDLAEGQFRLVKNHEI